MGGIGIVAFIVVALMCAGAAIAFVKVPPPVGDKWEEYAKQYMVVFREKDRAFDPAKDTEGLRCVKMNNYGCLWQRGNPGPWEGTPGPDGKDGAHDGEGGHSGGHAIFSHPKWSIVASMRWFEKRTRGGKTPKTAIELAEAYSPWCDTQGSKGTKSDESGQLWGRSCKSGKQPPDGFTGPLCQMPADGKPSTAQCQACNCPSSIAEYWLRKSETATDAPLTLFDAAGKPTDALKALIVRKIGLETGRYRPNQTLMDEAVKDFQPQN